MKKEPNITVVFEIEGIGPVDNLKLTPSGIDLLAEVFGDYFKNKDKEDRSNARIHTSKNNLNHVERN